MTDPPAELAHIPPLPAPTEPPRLPPDPRQRDFAGLVERLSGALGDATRVQPANLSSGFHASAVDLGRLSVETQDDAGYYQYAFDVMPGRTTT